MQLRPLHAARAVPGADVSESESQKAREAEGALAQASGLRPLKLDLGSGRRPREGFQGVDIAHLPGITRFDLTGGDKWPWLDDSVDELSSSHFIEHIAADYVSVVRKARGLRPEEEHAIALVERVSQDRLLFFFDEAFRVIKPDGLFHLAWPALQSTDAFRDPTHRRFIPLEMLYYLSAESRAQMGLEHYEVQCNWVIVGESVHLAGAGFDLPGFEDEGFGQGPRLPVDLNEHAHFWNVQREWRVTLQAKKQA
jgi:predicted SAM-dependent methyltransferase